MDAVLEVQLLFPRHAFEKERDERQSLLLREAREETAEPLLVLRSVAGRYQHSAEEDARSGLAGFPHDSPQVLLGLLERQAPEAVVGSQCQNDDVRSLREDPLRPPEAAGGRIARNSRVHRADRPSPLRELFSNDGRKRLVDRKAEPRREAVAQEDDEGRAGGDRPRGSRIPGSRAAGRTRGRATRPGGVRRRRSGVQRYEVPRGRRALVSPPPATGEKKGPQGQGEANRAPHGGGCYGNARLRPTMTPLLELRGITKELPSGTRMLRILDDVHLAIGAGEFVAILGPSGSGKSTLLGLMAGLDRPTGGEVLLEGAPIHAMSEDALALLRRRKVGFVFQSYQLLSNMTARENVLLPLELAGHGDAGARATELLATVGLAERGHHYPAQLSGGEQQRVALARAFGPRPPLLLADEPTGNLDSATGSSILDVLVHLRAESGTTLVLVTHDPAVAALAGRRIHLRDGRIERDETAS